MHQSYAQHHLQQQLRFNMTSIAEQELCIPVIEAKRSPLVLSPVNFILILFILSCQGHTITLTWTADVLC